LSLAAARRPAYNPAMVIGFAQLLTGLLAALASAAATGPRRAAMAASGLLAARRRRAPGPPGRRPKPAPRKAGRPGPRRATRRLSHAPCMPSRRDRDREWEREVNRRIAQAKSGFLASCRRADVKDYQNWLRGPGRTTPKRKCNYDLRARNTHTDRCWGYPEWLVAERDIEVTPLFGAMAVSIIVPPGVKLTGDLGHSQAYLPDGRVLGDYQGKADRFRNT